MGLCVTDHENPRMTWCRGEEIWSKAMVSRWDLIVSSSGIISSMMAPDRSGIGFLLMTLGMECVWPKNMSIKQVVAPESSRVVMCITRVPTCKLTSTIKSFRDGASWIELIIRWMEPNCIALTAPGPFHFLVHNYLSPGKRQQDVQSCHATSCCLIDVVVVIVHLTTIGSLLYLPPSA